jgi:transposase-like protein
MQVKSVRLRLIVLRPETKVWTSKYLNDLIEQDHRRVKSARLPNARFQELQECGSDNLRNRANAENQEETVQHLIGDNERSGERAAGVG